MVELYLHFPTRHHGLVLKQLRTGTTLPFSARFEVFRAVIMKNAVFWDIRIQFVPHRRHIMSPLHNPAG
jgi:hypothetical protein